jgi:hypothetical protein
MISDADLKRRCWYGVLAVRAEEIVAAGQVPAYLWDALPSELLVDLAKQYRLPLQLGGHQLLALAVALHIALSEPERPQPKYVKREIDQFFNACERVSLAAKSLSAGAWLAITGPTGPVDDDTSDVFGQLHQHILDDFETALDALLQLRVTAEIERGESGRRLSPEAMAEFLLDGVLVRHGCALKPIQRAELSHALFEAVKEHHGRRSRAEGARPEDLPRTQDLIRRTRSRRKE